MSNALATALVILALVAVFEGAVVLVLNGHGKREEEAMPDG